MPVCASNAPTTVTASPVTTLNTPLGMPHAIMHSARSDAESGVSSLGFTTCVQPAASAGPTLRAIIASGKFHGVTAIVAPSASRTAKTRRSAMRDAMMLPSRSSPALAAASKKVAEYSTSPRASRIGLPHSSVMVLANTSQSARTRAATDRSSRARSAAVVRLHESNARTAASAALAAVAAEHIGTRPTTVSVAGFRTSRRSPSQSVTRRPSIKHGEVCKEILQFETVKP